MDVSRFYDRVAARLPKGFDIEPEALTHAVLMSLARRLTPDEAADLGAELPDELGDLLAVASGRAAGSELRGDDLIEDIAARLDLDDDDAELGASAVLVSLRQHLEPMVPIEQVLATLPPDLARLMHG